MGVRDAARLTAVRESAQGKLTTAMGMTRTGLSRSQFLRLKARYRRLGPPGVVHGNRGRRSPRRISAAVRRQIEQLLKGDVPLNDHHIRDLLAEEQVTISADTVHRIRRALGRPPKQRRRGGTYRRRREPSARAGEMVQIDGSPFAWLGPDQPRQTLAGTIDDAEGRILSLNLRAEEDLHGFTQAVADLVRDHGVPWLLYGDRTNIAVRNDRHWTREEELAGRQMPSHFGQMLEALGIRYVAAHSPQAKGRIERLWRTLQDRLAAELRLRRHATLAAAQAYLPGFIRRFNARFARAASDPHPAWRPAPRHLDRIFACRYPRIVRRDHQVSIPGVAIALPPGPGGRGYAGCVVEVRELLDGRILVMFEDRVLLERPAPSGSFTLAPRRGRSAPAPVFAPSDPPASPPIDERVAPRLPTQARSSPRRRSPGSRKPADTHPWKRGRWPEQRQARGKKEIGPMGVSESLRR